MTRLPRCGFHLALLALVVSGCSYKEDDFVADFDAAYCDYVEACYDGATCDFDITPTCETEFDPEKAQICIEELADSEAACEGDSPAIPRYCVDPCVDE